MTAVVALLGLPSAAPAADLHATPETFAGVFAVAQGGDTVYLAAGDYGVFRGAFKAPTVTIRPEPGAVARMAPILRQASGLHLDGLAITDAEIGGSARDIAITNSDFAGAQIVIRADQLVDANVLLDGNRHVGFEKCQGCHEGRVQIVGDDDAGPAGVTISGSYFAGGFSDGIQNGGDGVRIVGNTFRNLPEDPTGRVHVDAVQLYGSRNTVIRGNYFRNTPNGVVAFDGADHELIEDNVFDNTPAGDGNALNIVLTSDDGSIVRHNTLVDGPCYNGRCGAVRLSSAKLHLPLGAGTVIKDNILSHVAYEAGSTTAEEDYNLLANEPGSGAADVRGTPAFVGGPAPGSLHGYRLADSSPGRGDASDGADRGARVAELPAPPDPAPTSLPTAVWTPPVGERSGLPVTFDGSGSQGDGPLACAWAFLDERGREVERLGGCVVQRTTWKAGPTRVKLIVTDFDGDTDADEQTVVLLQGPNARALWEPPEDARSGQLVTLDGSESEGDAPLSCTWSLLADDGSVGETLTGCTVTKAFATAATVTAELAIVDADGETSASRQSFDVRPPPNARAVWTAPESAPAGAPVALDGSASEGDPPLRCTWSVLAPDGALVDRLHGCVVARTFADAGPARVRLDVTDSDGDGDANVQSFVVGGPVPNAKAVWSAPVDPRAGVAAAFDGSASEGDAPLACAWEFPDETLTGCVVTQAFTATGPTTVRLRVTDADGDSDASERSFSVRSGPNAKAVWTPPVAPRVGQTVRLDGSASEGDGPLSCSWELPDGTLNGCTVDKVLTAAGTTQVTLRVTDADGDTDARDGSFTVRPAPPGLVGEWGFDAAQGGTVTDSSGRGNAGTISGAAAATGRYHGALRFDGVNDRVVVPDRDWLDLGPGMTVEAWVSPDSVGSLWRTVALKERGAGLSYSLYGGSSAAGRPSAHIATPGESLARGPAALSAGQWSHVAGTYNGATLRFYVNGVQVATRAVTGAVTAGTGPLSIGGNGVWANEWFAGRIDEVRIYNRALTATEVQADMTTPVAYAPAAPAALSISPAGLAFTTTQGAAAPAPKALSIVNSGGGTMTWTASESASWLEVSPTGGTGETLTVSPSTAGLAAGTYTTEVTVTAPGASGSPKAIPVVLTVEPEPPPALSVTPSSLTFGGSEGGAAPAAQTLAVTNTGGGTMPWTASESAGWLDVSPAGGTGGTLTVSPSTAGLTAGSYTTTLTVTAAGATGSPKAVGVTLNVLAPPPPPPSALVAAWSFDEPQGSAVVDASGRGHVGTIAGAARTAGGRFGGALRFDGVDDWVTVADTPALDAASGLTMEAWVNPAATGTSWRTVMLKEHTTASLSYALYGANALGRPAANVFTTRDLGTAATVLTPPNAWTHLAATHDGATLRLYVNGTQAASRAAAGSLRASTGPLRIGGNAVWNEWFSGLIDEVRIYDRPLAATEIQADMVRPIGG